MKIPSILFIRVLLFLILLVATTSAALAQTPTPDTSAISADRVNEVARGLWCPLCSGVRLDVCELKACVQMKEVIAIKLAEGVSEEEIKAYFMEQYGPQILGEPPREDFSLLVLAYKEGAISVLTWGFNWLAWILPVVGLLGGGLFVWFVMRRMIRSKPAAGAAPAKSAAPPDDYSQKLEQELSRYD